MQGVLIGDISRTPFVKVGLELAIEARHQLGPMETTLAIDTALTACSVAILRGPERVFDKFFSMARGHAETLPLLVRDALSEAGMTPGQIDRIGVVTGPGSFVGIRVGVSFARGFAIGRDVTLVGISSLRALAATARANGVAGPIAPIIDARRGQVYGALYDDNDAELIAPFISDAEAASEIEGFNSVSHGVIIGSGASLIAPPSDWRVDATLENADPIALANLAQRLSPTDYPVQPLYLRSPDATPGAKSLFEGLPD